jgi:hypothetical protein
MEYKREPLEEDEVLAMRQSCANFEINDSPKDSSTIPASRQNFSAYPGFSRKPPRLKPKNPEYCRHKA